MGGREEGPKQIFTFFIDHRGGNKMPGGQETWYLYTRRATGIYLVNIDLQVQWQVIGNNSNEHD